MQIKSIEWSRDITILPVDERWYRVPHPMKITMVTDCGVYRFKIAKNFMFDGRSGPTLVDMVGIAPNLGSQAEVKSWFLHDCLAYDIGLSFKETNYALYYSLREYAGYGRFRAKIIQGAVSISDAWFGEPVPGEREYCNHGKISTTLSHK